MQRIIDSIIVTISKSELLGMLQKVQMAESNEVIDDVDIDCIGDLVIVLKKGE